MVFYAPCGCFSSAKHYALIKDGAPAVFNIGGNFLAVQIRSDLRVAFMETDLPFEVLPERAEKLVGREEVLSSDFTEQNASHKHLFLRDGHIARDSGVEK